MNKSTRKNGLPPKGRSRSEVIRYVKHHLTVILASLAVLLVVVSSVVAVRAYLEAKTDDKQNPFHPITYTNTEITEDYAPDTLVVSEDPTDHLYKATKVVSKSAYVHNLDGEDKKPVFARVAIVPTVRITPVGGGLPENITSQVDFTINFAPGDDWVQNGSYYYYKTMLMPGDSSTDMFKDGEITVTYSGESGLFSGGIVEVDIAVVADTIQAVETDSADRTTWVYTDSVANSTWGVSGIFTVPQSNSGSGSGSGS